MKDILSAGKAAKAEEAKKDSAASGSKNSSEASKKPVDPVKSVVSDRQNGRAGKEDVTPDPKKLAEITAPGAVATTDHESTHPPDSAADAEPESLEDLPPERINELDEDLNSALDQIQAAYGPMTEIYYTPCSGGDRICADHGLQNEYLTMTTENGAKIMMALKRVNGKWERYTISFDPGPTNPAPASEEIPA